MGRCVQGREWERARLADVIGEDEVVLTRFNELELLQGAADEREWGLLAEYLEVQDYLECGSDSWREAARIFLDLRRRGLTVRSPIGCCIAELAMAHGALLVHRDRDFETIAEIRPLRQNRLP